MIPKGVDWGQTPQKELISYRKEVQQMTKNMMKLGYGSLSNIASIKINDLGFKSYNLLNGMEDTTDMVDRLISAASILPAETFLGMQMALDSNGEATGYVFSGKDTKVTKEDYAWIYSDWAEVNCIPEGDWDLDSGDRKMYALKFNKGIDRSGFEKTAPGSYGNTRYKEYRESLSNLQIYLSALRKVMSETGAMMRLFTGKDRINGEGFGCIFLCMPSMISLRVKTAITMAFPGSEVIDAEDPRLETYRISTPVIKESMIWLLQMFSYDEEKMRNDDHGYYNDDYDDLCYENVYHESYDNDYVDEFDEGYTLRDDDVDTFEEYIDLKDPNTGIADLEFSIRTYNCLKRAGINTVGELRKKTYEDLTHIRNLGRKCIDEIREKLGGFPESEAEAEMIESKHSYVNMLNELIGLEDVKEQVKKITAFARMKKDLPQNLKVPVALNMEFVGKPGTAKTTVARIMAGLLCEVGLLKSEEIVEVGRSDLVAKYVGQTAVKVREVFSKAEGKLLFIDEAYSLVDFWEGEFGDEAINTIVQEMENRRDKTVVVFAGYPDKMEDFFSRNPGLRSRVPYKITFKDYSVEELVKITELEAAKRGFTINLKASEKLTGIYETVKDDPNSGNGRFCRNVVEAAILNYATRVYGIPDTDAEACNTVKDFTLTDKDFESVNMDQQSKNNKPIGFR